jgi:hypothetical protein
MLLVFSLSPIFTPVRAFRLHHSLTLSRCSVCWLCQELVWATRCKLGEKKNKCGSKSNEAESLQCSLKSRSCANIWKVNQMKIDLLKALQKWSPSICFNPANCCATNLLGVDLLTKYPKLFLSLSLSFLFLFSPCQKPLLR